MTRNNLACCQNCPYWDGSLVDDCGHGLCVRRSPSLPLLPEEQGWGEWPKTAPSSWCGEHPEFWRPAAYVALDNTPREEVPHDEV